MYFFVFLLISVYLNNEISNGGILVRVEMRVWGWGLIEVGFRIGVGLRRGLEWVGPEVRGWIQRFFGYGWC